MKENKQQKTIEGAEDLETGIKENPIEKPKIKKINKPIKIKKPNKIKMRFSQFKERNKEKIEFIKRFILYSISYGIPINYMLWAIFNIPFVPWGFPAYGIFWYLLSEELPPIKNKFFPLKR